jgi:hypothetical protein
MTERTLEDININEYTQDNTHQFSGKKRKGTDFSDYYYDINEISLKKNAINLTPAEIIDDINEEYGSVYFSSDDNQEQVQTPVNINQPRELTDLEKMILNSKKMKREFRFIKKVEKLTKKKPVIYYKSEEVRYQEQSIKQVIKPKQQTKLTINCKGLTFRNYNGIVAKYNILNEDLVLNVIAEYDFKHFNNYPDTFAYDRIKTNACVILRIFKDDCELVKLLRNKLAIVDCEDELYFLIHKDNLRLNTIDDFYLVLLDESLKAYIAIIDNMKQDNEVKVENADEEIDIDESLFDEKYIDYHEKAREINEKLNKVNKELGNFQIQQDKTSAEETKPKFLEDFEKLTVEEQNTKLKELDLIIQKLSEENKAKADANLKKKEEIAVMEAKLVNRDEVNQKIIALSLQLKNNNILIKKLGEELKNKRDEIPKLQKDIDSYKARVNVSKESADVFIPVCVLCYENSRTVINDGCYHCEYCEGCFNKLQKKEREKQCLEKCGVKCNGKRGNKCANKKNLLPIKCTGCNKSVDKFILSKFDPKWAK